MTMAKPRRLYSAKLVLDMLRSHSPHWNELGFPPQKGLPSDHALQRRSTRPVPSAKPWFARRQLAGVALRRIGCGTSLMPLVISPLRCYIASREAASCVRSHISPGPYRSFRELSLTGSVDPDIWCPPTFVGNSGIECSNGDRGFALSFRELCLRTASHHSTARHTPRMRGIQYAAAVQLGRGRLWNTGSPAYVGDDRPIADGAA